MQSYRVKDGVLWCAGQRVPADRIVMLTAAQAQHAPVEGLVSAAAAKAAPQPRRSAKPSRDDGGAVVAPLAAPKGDAS